MSSPGKFGLNESDLEAIKSVFAKHSQIKKVILYGSRAKGDHKEGSDIDLTIVAPSLTTSDLLKIENEIDDLMLPHKVDLSLHHKIENDDLIDHISRMGIVFY